MKWKWLENGMGVVLEEVGVAWDGSGLFWTEVGVTWE